MIPWASLTLDSGTSVPPRFIVPASAFPFRVMVIVPGARGVPPGGICSIVQVPMKLLGAGAALATDVADVPTMAANANKTLRGARNITRLTVAQRFVTRRFPRHASGPHSPSQLNLETQNSLE